MPDFTGLKVPDSTPVSGTIHSGQGRFFADWPPQKRPPCAGFFVPSIRASLNYRLAVFHLRLQAFLDNDFSV